MNINCSLPEKFDPTFNELLIASERVQYRCQRRSRKEECKWKDLSWPHSFDKFDDNNPWNIINAMPMEWN